MRIRGALHVHSTFSHDGTLTVAELGRFYARRGFQFVAIGEHSQDVDADKIRQLVEQSASASNAGLLIVPGIEYTCSTPGMHILGVGARGLAPDADPLTAARLIREHRGFAVLAHPRRLGWSCPAELLAEIHAVEMWNVSYDGKYLPTAHALEAFRRMKAANSKLLAVASHDLHREPAFYDVAIEMEVNQLTCEAVLENLRAGAFHIRSRYFSCDSELQISWSQAALLRVFSSQLSCFRRARARALRWSL